ncbi:MAG: hypothetical protein RLZZ490_1743 [Cyanobacteriota bacterium]
MSPSQKLLLLSNGHGEDTIAIQIGQAWSELVQAPPAETLTALPLVGEGHGYQKLSIPFIGPVKAMPSGGFNNMDGRELWRDVQGGLWGLTQAQLGSLRQWTTQGGTILAVGDILPLALAWLSGAEYYFVGTAKSEYYLRQPSGEWLTSTAPWERWLGSAYYPWERWLMTRPLCRAVFPRDRLTHERLWNQGVPSQNLGNPMMDGLGNCDQIPAPLQPGQTLTLLLLPGSRSPEAERNWQIILQSLTSVMDCFPDRPIQFLGAIAPSLSLEPFLKQVIDQPWQPVQPDLVGDYSAHHWHQGNARLTISQQAFVAYLHQAQGAIAMAGTATEQCVGLGKPVVTIPGQGPQFNPYFARRQTWLLGESVSLVNQPDQAGVIFKQLLQDGQRLTAIARNGRERLGEAGAARRIAEHLMGALR